MKLLRFIGPKKGQRDAWFKNGEVYPLKDQTRLGKFIDHVVRTFSTASSPEKPTSFKTLLHMASPFGWNFPEAQYVLGLYLHSIEEWKMAGYFISLASDAGIKSAKWMCHLIQRRSAYSKTYGLELSANQSTSLLASSLNLIGDVPVSLLDYLRKVQVIGNAIIALKDAERNYCHVETPATRPKREVYDLDFRSIYQRIDPTKLEEVLHNKNFIPSIKDMKLINKIRVVALNLHSLLEEIKPLAQELRCKLQVDRSNFKHAEITLRIKRLDEILGSPEQSSTTDQQNQSIFALLKQKNHRGFP
ncbi:uncharacterized protein BJ171DRAFT_146242 [Polychytrium aggregatum]|uniref:uncharacterized protein n=1 Tax=Polychytrium aggregatum TaxID=110093 RepID=UPI0022FE4D49|nr:uncharacterized protein BJ171DRAFT_146242 [Polychytrium aggregatum]KAI9203562.1 hypothetical protein BJ171DRAFT_146242 [Polychytrium aggregatum]